LGKEDIFFLRQDVLQSKTRRVQYNRILRTRDNALTFCTFCC